MKEDTQKLLEKLKELDQHFGQFPEDKEKHVSESGYFFVSQEHEHLLPEEIDALPEGFEKKLVKLYHELGEHACGGLISADGQCNWSQHRILKQHGYPVRAGERDSFGWLTGVIHGNNFKFCYG